MRVLVSYHLVQEALLNRPGFVEDAEQVWQLMRSGQIQGYMTQTGLDIIYIDLYHSEGEDYAEEKVSKIKEVVEVRSVDCSIREQARASNLSDFESAKELAYAIGMNLDAIVTQHPQNFDGSPFLVLSVTELLAQIERVNRLNRIFYQEASPDSSQVHPLPIVKSEQSSEIEHSLEYINLLNYQTLLANEISLDYRIRNSVATVLNVFEILKREETQGISRQELASRAGISETTLNSVIWDLQNFNMAFRQEGKIVVPQYLLDAGESEIVEYLAGILRNHIVTKKVYEYFSSKTKSIYRRGLQELIADLFSNEKSVSDKSLSDYTSRILGWLLYTGLLEIRGDETIVRPSGVGKQKGKLREEPEFEQLQLLSEDWDIITKVLPENEIEISVPELPVDDAVEVSVTKQNTSSRSHRSAIDLLDELPGQRLFKTPEEAERYLQEERSAWEN
jgi:hypothetical protein